MNRDGQPHRVLSDQRLLVKASVSLLGFGGRPLPTSWLYPKTQYTLRDQYDPNGLSVSLLPRDHAGLSSLCS
ncbi:hypothetical protein Taro_053200 [Colocasia esculenta]|uniref:Uncharacterized protein n=1 Tax=Colocasia esculenta TaxID=4460 RepID=A0A843XKJ2_COLES|nr:hypothetical protein [Colocasia esculenta]